MYPPQELSKYPPYDHCFTTIANEILASSNNKQQRSGSYFAILFDSLSLESIFPSKQSLCKQSEWENKVLSEPYKDSFKNDWKNWLTCKNTILKKVQVMRFKMKDAEWV